jgi:hypothetical protein
MAQGFTNAGERLLLSRLFQTGTVEVTIYNDTSDTITDTDTVAAITEPQGNQYTRATISADDVTITTVDGDAVLDIGTQFFDVSDSTMSVNAYAYIADGTLIHRGLIQVPDTTTDSINLDEEDDLLLGGQPAVIGD